MNPDFDVEMMRVNPRVFLDVTIDGVPTGRLVFELFADVVPKTAENFRALCTELHRTLTFMDSPFHHIIPGFVCQGGDFTRWNGTGGRSIYDGYTFADENFTLKHSKRGMLSMANAGKDTNGSQFFITLAPLHQLDGQHVVFGQLVSGEDVLRQIELQGTSSGSPRAHVSISNCGEL